METTSNTASNTAIKFDGYSFSFYCMKEVTWNDLRTADINSIWSLWTTKQDYTTKVQEARLLYRATDGAVVLLTTVETVEGETKTTREAVWLPWPSEVAEALFSEE